MTTEDAIAAALGCLHQDEVVELTRELVRIPSVNPPGGEAPVAELLARKLDAEGIPSTFQDVKPGRPNLLARLGGEDGPHLVLNGHMDVVGAGNRANWSVDPFAAEVREGRILGRGACDMKGGVAALACAFVAIHRARLPLAGTLTYAAVMGEETGSEGARYLLDSGFRADAAIVGESSSAGKVGIGYRGAAWFEITTSGRTSHGSRPHLGNNAVLQMTDLVIPTVRQTVATLPHTEPPEFLIPRPTLNIGTIQGGFKVNVVPDACTASFDVRLPPGVRTDTLLAAVTEALEARRASSPELQWEMKILYQTEPFITDRTTPMVRAMAASIEAITGAPAHFFGKTGFSDANAFSHRGIPSVAYGPGVVGSGHSPDEWVGITDLYQVARVYAATAVRFCGLKGE